MRDGFLPVTDNMAAHRQSASMASLTFCAALAMLATPALGDSPRWQLTLTLVEPGTAPITTTVGELVSLRACHVTGDAFARLLIAQIPTLTVGVSCREVVDA